MSTPPVHIHDDGEGDPIVFLHAFPLDAAMWDPQVVGLRDRYRCLRPDYWGFGESPPPNADHGLDTYAATIFDQLAEMGIEEFSVVGLSMGGYVAFSMLRQAPERIRKLVLAATRATADSAAGRAERRAMATAVLSEGIDVIVEGQLARLLSPRAQAATGITTFVRARMAACSPTGIAACQDAMATRPDSTPMLESIDTPTLVVAGGEDALIPADVVREMADSIPDAKISVLETSGHLVNIEAPEVFTDLVDWFVGD